MSRPPDKAQILRKLREHRSEIRSLGARRLGLFGSAARDEASETSDLDFLVEFEPGAKSFDSFMDLRILLEDLFACPVDLVLAEKVKPRLRPSIFREVVHAPGL